MSLNVKPLTHSEAIKNQDEVWVINNSSGANERARGILFMSVKDGDRDVAVQVPATWLPQNVLEYISHAALVNSVDFRNLVREKHLVPISPSDAKAILNSGEALAEKTRLAELKASMPGAARTATNSGDTVAIHTGGGATIMAPAEVANSDAENTQIVQLIAQFNANTVSDEHAVEVVRRMFNMGEVSISQLQMSAMKINNTSSALYRAFEALISGIEEGTGSTGPTFS